MHTIHRSHRGWLARVASAVAAAVALAVGLAACGGNDGSGDGEPQGEVVITCTSCQPSPTDPGQQYFYEATKRFNEQNKGKYRIEIRQNQYAAGGGPERLQYYRRLALADDLPDLFIVSRGGGELAAMEQTGKLMDLAPALDADAAWKGSFHDGVFNSLKGDGGKIWAIPTQRDALGFFYNKQLFQKAGISEFPQSWDELQADCAKLKAAGKVCLAMDGDWTTLLLWANLIGTQPGGADFLTSGITGTDYAENPAVVRATETLKRWHTEGFTNRDAFSGDYPNAAAAFVRGDAAIAPNGPWMVSEDIKGKDAPKALYGELGYTVSPGWTAGQRGVVLVAGEGGWVSAARDERKQEAVVAFLKFITKPDEAFKKTLANGTYPAVKLELSAAQQKQLEPLAAGLQREVDTVSSTYPHVYTRAPGGFGDAWKNLWPAYVKGELDTKAFLGELAQDASSKTG